MLLLRGFPSFCIIHGPNSDNGVSLFSVALPTPINLDTMSRSFSEAKQSFTGVPRALLLLTSDPVIRQLSLHHIVLNCFAILWEYHEEG